MLDEPLLPVDLDTGPTRTTLTGVLAALARDELGGFPGLAAHQRHGWALFLYQLGAIALHRAGLDEPPDNEESWRDLLLALTDGAKEPWMLVVDDLSKPALLQPPTQAGGLERYNVIGGAPDEIDVLVTAKAHDVKPARLGAAEPHHWFYALLTLQTMQGFYGRGNYGIARMNGGFASRPLVELVDGRSWGRRWRRALRVARVARADMLTKFEGNYLETGGEALLWLKPWDGGESPPLQDLDPFFIEIGRRARLVRDPDGRIVAYGRNSEAARLNAKALLGNLGDPWLPIETGEAKALTVGGGGFDYRLVTRLLDEASFEPPASLTIFDDDPGDRLTLHMTVLARGQGETQGLHDRWLDVPGKAMRRFRRLPAQTAGIIGEAMRKNAADALGALRAALVVYVQGGPAKADFRDARVKEPVAALDRRIDQEVFFQHYWPLVLAEDDDTRVLLYTAWRADLRRLVHAAFDAAVAGLAAPSQRRERARAKAQSTLGGMLFKSGLIEPKENAA